MRYRPWSTFALLDAATIREMAERSVDEPTVTSLPVGARPVGLDVAGADLVVGRVGLRSPFSNRQSHLGQWGRGGEHPLWLSPGGVLLAVAQGELEDEEPLAAVVAVPGWFGFAERRAVCSAVACEPHRVVAMVASTTAAAVHWYAQHSFIDARCVLAVDVRTGVTVSVTTLGPGGVVERCVAGLPPDAAGLVASGATQALDALVDDVVARMVSLSLTPFDALLLIGDTPSAETTSRAMACLRRIGAAHWPPVEPHLLDDAGSVAEGAALLAAGRRPAPDVVVDPAAWTFTAVAPRGLGVLVERVDRGTEVVEVLPAWSALPTAAGAVFADPRDEVDTGSDGSAPAVAVQWFELGADGIAAPIPLLVTTLVSGAVMPDASAAGVIEAQLMVHSDGSLVPRPASAWVTTPGPSSVAIVERVPQQCGPLASGQLMVASPMAVTPMAGPGAALPHADEFDPWPPPGLDAVAPLHAPIEQPPLSFLPPVLPAPDPAQRVPEAQGESEAPDTLAEGAMSTEPPLLVPIDDGLLELLANAEASPVALDEALLRCERVLSNEIDSLVAVRSVYDLLDCDDDAGQPELRAAARRLEQALEVRGAGDDLAAAVGAAVRAARRSFSDPLERRFLGGSRRMLEHELAQVVENLRLVVGEVSDTELQRLVADARRGGLAPNRIATVLAVLVGREAADRVADLAADGSQAVVIVDPGGGRCRLAHPDEAGVRIRVMVEQSAFAAH